MHILVVFLNLLIALSVFSLQLFSWWNLIFCLECLLNYYLFSCSIEWWSHILLKFLLIVLVVHSTFLLSWNIVDFCDLTWWLSDILLLVDMLFIISMLWQLLTFLCHEHHIIVLLMLVFVHNMQLIIFILDHQFVVTVLSWFFLMHLHQ